MFIILSSYFVSQNFLVKYLFNSLFNLFLVLLLFFFNALRMKSKECKCKQF
jgi:hypothetical protein